MKCRLMKHHRVLYSERLNLINKGVSNELLVIQIWMNLYIIIYI